MPRGQYDRSKTKEQRAAEKNAKAAPVATKSVKAAGAKRGPKPGFKKNKGQGSNVGQLVPNTPEVAKAQNNAARHFSALFEIRGNLAVLASLSDKFGASAILQKEIDANVELMGRFRQELFPAPKPAVVEEVEDAEEPIQAAPTSAPVSNGANFSIPLPPSAPVIPHS